MKILHISHSDLSGGAARASYRIHRPLFDYGISSTMVVQKKVTDDYSVFSSNNSISKITHITNILIGKKIVKLQQSSNSVYHTACVGYSDIKSSIKKTNPDVINLHWISEAPSIKSIGGIHKPVVWTLHDMWPFCGSEHYANESLNSRWSKGYLKINRPEGHRGIDIDRWTWLRKKKHWDRPFHIVAPSRWMANMARNSALMSDWPCTVIPYSLDSSRFKPIEKKLARNILNLPQDKSIILFGAIGGEEDYRKGFDLLQAALNRLKTEKSVTDFECLIFGQEKLETPSQLAFKTIWFGFVHDDWTLSLLYSAADIMVVPSRQDNLPQTGTEAQMCGCPVVAFNVGGLPDVVEHKKTGFLANPFDPKDLASGMFWILEDKERYRTISENSRERALKLWSPDVIVPQYLNVYQHAIEQQKANL